VRQVHQDILDALTRIHQCQVRLDCSSKLHDRLRGEIDALHPQLTPAEKQDVYWFSVSLDMPEGGPDGCEEG